MQVNKVIYILLALFLGSLVFINLCRQEYARYSTLNILLDRYPTHLAIISAVINVFKPADEQGNVTL